MRTLNRNSRKFFYRRVLGTVPIVNDDGYETGEYKKKYGKLKAGRANITSTRGERYVRDFGESLEYDRRLIVRNIDLKEGDVLWVDDLNVLNPHDYIVVRVSDTLNHKMLAIRKVDVSGR